MVVGYVCNCTAGYTGQNCEQDINECSVGERGRRKEGEGWRKGRDRVGKEWKEAGRAR